MKRSQTLLTGMAGILIVGAVTLVRFSHAGGAASAPPDAQPIPVTATRVAAHDVELYLTGIGTIQAFNTVTIRPRVDGELVKVAFHEGQAVRKGDLLLQIDQRPYQAALDNALANLAKDQAVLATAKRDLARYQETAAKGYTSRQQFETQASAVDGRRRDRAGRRRHHRKRQGPAGLYRHRLAIGWGHGHPPGRPGQHRPRQRIDGGWSS